MLVKIAGYGKKRNFKAKKNTTKKKIERRDDTY